MSATSVTSSRSSGFVTRAGIDVETRDMGGGSEAVVGLTRGDVDSPSSCTRSFSEPSRPGAPIKAVLAQNVAAEVILVGGDGLRRSTISADKTVAVSSPGGTVDIPLTGALDRAAACRATT